MFKIESQPSVFRTSEHSRHPILSALSGRNEHVWSYVNLTHEKPWFYASYIVKKSETIIWPETILLSAVEQVKELFCGFRELLENRSLLLVSPDRVNQTGNWQMEPLKEIWSAFDPVHQDKVFVYVLANGRRYIDSNAPVDFPALQDCQCIVSTTSE